MKRLLACGLTLALGLALLPSCSKPSEGGGSGLPALDPQNPVSLEIWHYYNGPQKTAFDAMVTEFNETVGMERGIIVEAYSQGNVDGLIAKVTDAAQKKVGADEVPNIFAAYADTAYEVDKLGLLADLSPYLTEEELGQYRREFIDEGYLDGGDELKIFPIAKSVELFMLNETDWEKFAGDTGASLEDLSTMEGITRTAASYYQWTDSLTPQPDDGKAFFGRDAMANYMIIGMRQLGVEIFQVDSGTVTVNADKDALRRLWDNYYVPYINGWFTAGARFRADDAHMGDIVALVGSSSGATYFPTEVAVSDFESYPIESIVLPAPIFEGSQPYAVQQGAGMAVTKSDPATEYASTVFLKWFTEAERNVAFAVSSGYLPVKNDALDMTLIRAALSADPEADPRMEATFSAALDQLDLCTLYTTRAFEGGNAARSVLEDALSSQAVADYDAVKALMAGGLSRADAVARYDTDANFDAWYDRLTAALDDACAG